MQLAAREEMKYRTSPGDTKGIYAYHNDAETHKHSFLSAAMARYRQMPRFYVPTYTKSQKVASGGALGDLDFHGQLAALQLPSLQLLWRHNPRRRAGA